MPEKDQEPVKLPKDPRVRFRMWTAILADRHKQEIEDITVKASVPLARIKIKGASDDQVWNITQAIYQCACIRVVQRELNKMHKQNIVKAQQRTVKELETKYSKPLSEFETREVAGWLESAPNITYAAGQAAFEDKDFYLEKAIRENAPMLQSHAVDMLYGMISASIRRQVEAGRGV